MIYMKQDGASFLRVKNFDSGRYKRVARLAVQGQSAPQGRDLRSRCLRISERIISIKVTATIINDIISCQFMSHLIQKINQYGIQRM